MDTDNKIQRKYGTVEGILQYLIRSPGEQIEIKTFPTEFRRVRQLYYNEWYKLQRKGMTPTTLDLRTTRLYGDVGLVLSLEDNRVPLEDIRIIGRD